VIQKAYSRFTDQHVTSVNDIDVNRLAVEACIFGMLAAHDQTTIARIRSSKAKVSLGLV
jgi:hypothetical protein